MPTVERPAQDIERLAQAAAHLRQAIVLLEGVAFGVFEGLDPWIAKVLSHQPAAQDPLAAFSRDGLYHPLVTDRNTFCVRWAELTCHLGNTVAFKLIERLARRPNQFIHCDTLLEEIWDCHTSRAAVRSAVKVLRKKLTAAGMGGLAEAIDGSNSHHYGLLLNGNS